jgi:hypothetical protein
MFTYKNVPLTPGELNRFHVGAEVDASDCEDREAVIEAAYTVP